MAMPTASRQLRSRYRSAERISPAWSQFASAAEFPAEGDEIRQNIVTAITAEHWAEGKTGLAYFPPKPPSPEERGRTNITRGLWNFAYWETTRDSRLWQMARQFLHFSKLIDSRTVPSLPRREYRADTSPSRRRVRRGIVHSRDDNVSDTISITNEKSLVKSFSDIHITKLMSWVHSANTDIMKLRRVLRNCISQYLTAWRIDRECLKFKAFEISRRN